MMGQCPEIDCNQNFGQFCSTYRCCTCLVPVRWLDRRWGTRSGNWSSKVACLVTDRYQGQVFVGFGAMNSAGSQTQKLWAFLKLWAADQKLKFMISSVRFLGCGWVKHIAARVKNATPACKLRKFQPLRPVEKHSNEAGLQLRWQRFQIYTYNTQIYKKSQYIMYIYIRNCKDIKQIQLLHLSSSQPKKCSKLLETQHISATHPTSAGWCLEVDGKGYDSITWTIDEEVEYVR